MRGCVERVYGCRIRPISDNNVPLAATFQARTGDHLMPCTCVRILSKRTLNHTPVKGRERAAQPRALVILLRVP